MKALSGRAVETALKILDGLDPRSIPRYADVMKAAPPNIAIDADALAREQEIERKQIDWLAEWLRKRGRR